ncbi:MAG: TRAP transporter large permease subunit [Chloroflexota bacterium]|nr:TRAP transporter large permease subunit [Chloroflexota bacterium]
MSLALITLILLGTMVVLFAIGTEIAVAIGIVSAIGLMFFVNMPLTQFPYTAFDFQNSFVLTAIPLFVFMGSIFADTGVIRSLFTSADKLIGFLPGGVACSVLGANAIFGAICGSSLAATGTFGRIAFPEMERLGYDPKLSLGVIAIGGTLSVLIPPSIILIVYGFWENVSVVKLFAGGIIPGVLFTALLILTVAIQVKLNPTLVPRSQSYSLREKLIGLRDILPFLVVIGLVLGVIFGGVMTPTEAAALGAFLAIVFALIYRKMTWFALKDSMLTSVQLVSMIAYVAVLASVLRIVFQRIGLTEGFLAFANTLPLGRYGMWAMVVVLYLILGCFFESFSMLLLTLPFIGPLMVQLGFDLVWFGVVYVVLAEIGMVTPPFGLNLFVLNSLVPKYDIMTIAWGALPYLIPAMVLIALMTVFPQLVLWLPSIMY